MIAWLEERHPEPAVIPADPVQPAARKRASTATARSLHKGQQTRAAILEAALAQASHMGLEGLSIAAVHRMLRERGGSLEITAEAQGAAGPCRGARRRCSPH